MRVRRSPGAPLAANAERRLALNIRIQNAATLHVGSLDDPTGFFPTSHFGAEAILEEWLDTRHLDRMRSDEHPPLVERWEKAKRPT